MERYNMRKKLSAVGNSLALIIEKPILELLGIDRDTELEIKTDGEGLIVRPVREDHSNRVAAATERMMNVHEDTLKKLAK